MASGEMAFPRVVCMSGFSCSQFMFFTIWISSLHYIVPLPSEFESDRVSPTTDLPNSPHNDLFKPIEISPSVFPHLPHPDQLLAPIYHPTFPDTFEPVLTGRCKANFSSLSVIIDKTANDCFQSLASIVGNVVCCPQFDSLLHIFQGHYTSNSDNLALQNHLANDCFSDIISLLSSKRANHTISRICSLTPWHLTGGACPVKDVATFEKMVNTSRLLDACSAIDPLKECCRPVCRTAISNAVLRISGMRFMVNGDKDITSDSDHDCKGVVYSWLSRKLSIDTANNAFRIISACKVNRDCPLDFKPPTKVINACRNASITSSCCSSFASYITGLQNILITNKQAIICATTFGSMLQKQGIVSDMYDLCDVDLKEFSIQGDAYGPQGCLLRSLPVDISFDTSTGLTFTCDLNDNIAAPWPAMSSISSLSFCATEMPLPNLPVSETIQNYGYRVYRFSSFTHFATLVLLRMLVKWDVTWSVW